jgi:hypothetical protein
LKPHLVQKKSKFKVCNILATPSLLCGCEIWTLKQRDMRRLKTAETKCMTHTARYSLLYHRMNEDILEELKVHSAENKLAQYKQKWINHFSRMKDIRYPKISLTQIEVFWVVAQCSVAGYQQFRGHWEHRPLKHWYATTALHGVTFQKTST